MLGLLGFLATAGIVLFGFWQARRFVETRLRYVDAVHGASFPFAAALVAALVALPIAWLLPLVSGGTALLFGIAVGFGIASGARNLRRQLPPA